MKKYFFWAGVLFFIFGSVTAGADMIGLKNDNSFEGIIIQDTDQVLEIEVFLNARVSFDRKDIAFVKKWSASENQVLRDKWLADRVEREKADLALREFERKQKEKGLVKYNGEWITLAEREKLQTKEYIEELLQVKAARGDIPDPGRRNRTDIARALLAQGRWQSRQTEHFIIYYEDTAQSKAVADRAEYYYEKITYDLDYEKTINWLEKCEVFIVPNEDKWREYMRDFVGTFDHIGGFVPHTGEKEIYLCALSLPYLSIVFPHELTHLIFDEFAEDQAIPLWLNEGLAIYESGTIGYSDALLSDRVKQSKHIPLEILIGKKAYPAEKEENELFYAQSEKTVEFLITQHGRRQFSLFCRELVSGESFPGALKSAYDGEYSGLDEFKRAWIKYVLK